MEEDSMANTETKRVRKGIRTLYNPKVGCSYVVVNVNTGERSQGSTLTIRDHDQKPWRSPKSTPSGEEFFKMKSGTKRGGFVYYKFMNSINNPKCLSEDGVWEFIGLRTNGEVLQRVEDSNQESTDEVSAAIDDTSVSNMQSTTKAESESSNFSQKELREEIMDSEFSNPSVLEDIFSDV